MRFKADSVEYYYFYIFKDRGRGYESFAFFRRHSTTHCVNLLFARSPWWLEIRDLAMRARALAYGTILRRRRVAFTVYGGIF